MPAEQRCYGCAESFDRAALRDVGDAVFCAKCFEALFAKSGAREQGLDTQARERARAADASAEVWQCFLCKTERDDAPFVRLASFAICRGCSEELRPEPPPPKPEPRPAREEGAAVTAAPAVVYTPGSGTEICAGCARLMPGKGSYRTIEGRPYCPACSPLR